MAFGHFLLGSHNLLVMALGSCVKWPLVQDGYGIQFKVVANFLVIIGPPCIVNSL
jgi:hypothetical protein